MDKSQIYLIYTKKKLPCDLPRKGQTRPDADATLPETTIDETLPRPMRRKRKVAEVQFTETEVPIHHRLADSEMSVCEDYSHGDGVMVVAPFVEAGIDSITGLQDQVSML
jgi:hypothetical protein